MIPLRFPHWTKHLFGIHQVPVAPTPAPQPSNAIDVCGGILTASEVAMAAQRSPRELIFVRSYPGGIWMAAIRQKDACLEYLRTRPGEFEGYAVLVIEWEGGAQ